MRVFTTAAALAACLIAGAASASTILISSDASNVGNGNLLHDPDGVAASAAAGLNGETIDSESNVGRALAFNGSDFSIGDGTDLAQIEDNQGIAIDGFANYRVEYDGGNDAYGFIEEGNPNVGGANTAFDGAAFANSKSYFLLSDDIAVAGGAATDTFNLSAIATSRDALPSVTSYIYFDNGTGINLGTVVGSPSLSGVAAPAAGYSSVRVGFFVDGGNVAPSRLTALDNINLERVAIPEPGSVALSLLALAGLGFRRVA